MVSHPTEVTQLIVKAAEQVGGRGQPLRSHRHLILADPGAKGARPVPMIEVYAVEGTFSDPHALAQSLAAVLMSVEQVPDIPMFRKNTAAFVHEMPAASLSNVDGDSTYVRVQVLTNAGALDRDKQMAAVARLTAVVADVAGDPFARRPHLGTSH
jgi:hypothetical protein